MKNKPTKILVFMLALTVIASPVVFAGEFFNPFKGPKGNYSEKLVIETPDGDSHTFMVELAKTPKEQEIGLMHRTNMKPNEGMLFLFDDLKDRSFWMKDTLIPLDMLFINEIGIVEHIYPDAEPLQTKGIPSLGPAKAVLEINGERAEELGITEGSRIIYGEFGR